MISRVETLLCILLLAAAGLSAEPNFSGRWAIQPAAGRGGGRGGPTILVLNQAGDQVTGTITIRVDAGSGSPLDPEIHGGRIEGQALSFYVWAGVDQPTKTIYKGTLSASGDEIAFSVTGVRIPGGLSGPSRPSDPSVLQQMTAKRVR